jgi:flavin-dependent dehydrogenase
VWYLPLRYFVRLERTGGPVRGTASPVRTRSGTVVTEFLIYVYDVSECLSFGITMYDTIIIGARCAGSTTAMLLAQKGYSVLVLDRATFPSDTMSTHIIKHPGVRQLEKWGLLDEVLATTCPALRQFRQDVGDFLLSGTAPPENGVPMIAPRRTVLDEILVDAAVDAGAEVREGFVVRKLLTEGGRVVGIEGQPKGGAPVTERARLVIAADGKNSIVARTVDPPTYDEHAPTAFYYYTYWPDLPDEGLVSYWSHHRFVLAIPTNGGSTCLAVGRPIGYYREFGSDVESSYHETLEIAPELADAVGGSQPLEPYIGTAVPNYFRRPYGPGWALVGDAGLCMDPLKGHGISDAFCDAELLADAVDAGFSGRRSLEDALAGYERDRNARKEGYYERNWKASHMEGWDAPPTLRLRAALRENPDQADRWAGTIAFSVDFDEFHSSEFVRNTTANAV